ncbi:glutamamyl carboxypeptidase [Trypanosoma cruzi]|uniref:Glutamamyl carboxypeptidase n=1 Tax=Trypanosoma cruzi TaxID=5693 RepID=A0A7J6XJK8_TRYCR|nr:glutamamyl carboxypeptidase [Trypanosoma cruzi]
MAARSMDHTQWLAKLVAFDTTSRNSNLELIHYCKDYLEGLGVKCTLLHNAGRNKANLWATLPGDGGVTKGGIILSGHTDVVPVDGQKWDSDPFTLTERDGKLYGRGTSDMKGFVAVCMSLAPELLKMKRAKPIHFAWSYDEEMGCLGGMELAEFARDHDVRAEGCIIGEPTGMTVVIAHKGTSHFWVRVRGKAAHSSLALTGESCNAIDYATKLITKLREIAEEYRRNGTRHDFEVPFSTLSTNLISGGNASNTVPAECEFLFEFRALPNETVSKMMQQVRSYVETQLLPAMKAEFEDAEIVITPRDETPSFEGSEEAPITKLVCAINNDYKVWKLAGCTEAGHYSGIAGAPTVICGPNGGAIHCANEYVTPAQLDKCREFVLRVAESLKASPAHL